MLDSLLLVGVGASGLWWLLQTAAAFRVSGTVPRLDRMPAAAHAIEYPRISMVIAARNEAAEVEAALRAKLACSYPNLQVVFVDDRSSDATSTIANGLARSDDRLRVLRVETLAPGWLGKVHALQRGLEQSDGDWVLFTDADVHLHGDVLQRCMVIAAEQGVDHIAALPRIAPSSVPVTLALASFFRLILLLGRPWKVSDPTSTAAFGVGAFNLVRRSALQRTPGLAWLKMEIADDVALGAMLKRWGARQRVVLAGELVDLTFYSSLRAMTGALEKNGAAAPFPALVIGPWLLVALELGYFWAVTIGTGAAKRAGLAVYACAVATQWMMARAASIPRWPALLPGWGSCVVAYAMMRAGLLAAVRGGVVWRGTFYSTDAVRAGSRLRLLLNGGGVAPGRSTTTRTGDA